MKKTFSLLLFTIVLRRLAVNLLALFSPLFVFQILTKSGQLISRSLLLTTIYFLIFYSVKIIFFPLAEKISFKLGFKWIIFLSVFPFLFYIIFLILASRSSFYLLPGAFFGGFQAAFFWFGYHGLFIKFSNESQFGLQAGLFQFSSLLALVFSPLIGAFFILNFGFGALFFLIFCLALLSAVIILISPLIKPYNKASFRKTFFLFKTHPRVLFAYLGWGGEATLYSSFWPIFLILIFSDISAYSQLITASILLAALMCFSIGKMVDKMKSKKIIRWGVFLGSFSWLLRIFSYWPLPIILVDGFYRLSEQMFTIPLDVFSYRKAREGGTSQALFFREFALNLGAVLFLLIAALIFWLNFPLWSVFLFGALGSLGPILIAKNA